jgi:hypothetical protein
MPFPNRPLRPAVDDCAITAMNVFVQARRTSAMVDVGVRVRGVKGGACRIMPATLQLATGKGSPVSRAFSLRFVDGQAQRPVNMAEGTGGEMLAPWVSMLRANEERQVVLRFYVEGADLSGTEIDPVGRLLLPLRNLGPRIYAGAPVQVKLQTEPGVRANLRLTLGDPRNASAPQATGADGSATVSGALSKDELLPVIEWRHDGELPAPAEADKLTTGLAVFEYLRGGLVQDLAAGLVAEEKKDEKKDDKGEKKDDKGEKKDDKEAKARAEAAWDKALDVALAATRSNDPVVAGMGLRHLAWLSSGLGAAATRVQAPGGTAAPDAAEVPEKIAEAASKAGDGFRAATGQKAAPSVGSAPFAKGALAKLGEPGSRKKEADEALKRLATRLDEGKVTVTVGSFFSTAPAIALAAGVKVPGARLIAWNKQGNPTFVATKPPVTPKAPLVQRVVHGISHVKGLAKFMALLAALAAVGVGAWWAFFRGRPAGEHEQQVTTLTGENHGQGEGSGPQGQARDDPGRYPEAL